MDHPQSIRNSQTQGCQRNTSSVCDMLQHLNWRNFEDKRKYAPLVMMSRITNTNVSITLKRQT